jgi:hypothetical protein
MESINFRDTNSTNHIQKTTQVNTAGESIDKDTKPTEAIKGSSMAFERPGLAHAERYTAIQEAMEKEKLRDLPEQYDPAKQIKALQQDDIAYQAMIQETSKTAAIGAGGISSVIGVTGKLVS